MTDKEMRDIRRTYATIQMGVIPEAKNLSEEVKQNIIDHFAEDDSNEDDLQTKE